MAFSKEQVGRIPSGLSRRTVFLLYFVTFKIHPFWILGEKCSSMVGDFRFPNVAG